MPLVLPNGNGLTIISQSFNTLKYSAYGRCGCAVASSPKYDLIKRSTYGCVKPFDCPNAKWKCTFTLARSRIAFNAVKKCGFNFIVVEAIPIFTTSGFFRNL